MADEADSKSVAAKRVGSSPTTSTKINLRSTYNENITDLLSAAVDT